MKIFSYNFQVFLPGGCAISGLQYLEVVQPPGIVSQKLLRKKNFFFVNMTAKPKIFWGVTLGPLLIHEKTRAQKFHAPVPLRFDKYKTTNVHGNPT